MVLYPPRRFSHYPEYADPMRSYVPLIARALLGLIFVMSGISKITGFEGTQQYMASQGMPVTALFLVAAIVVEILGGLSVILGL